MDQHLLFFSWSAIGFYFATIFFLTLLLFFTKSQLKKDNRIIDVFTNILIILGAIAWVVITS
ncbi:MULTISPECIES: hypothetical protein [Fictibacillus]|uniref:hypothetical protein n=1 Tax=Fictibacillus TaxID=1329200 RepID=UPI0018CEC9CC|nr:MULTISPECIES: hypothetical protein [unclassified Fictibacillus]MBH0157935.1 hypothetical protein [Fictibacillus sp. 5RED26]MBH0159671.1 hypothetical protein [Fictibacillus sp. 26RED30]